MTKKFRAGDVVMVRSAGEILKTLGNDGCVDGLPFMPEMMEHIGQQFRVSMRAHKTCDTINGSGGRWMRNAVHLTDVRCDGRGHGNCDADCSIFWSTSWLSPAQNRNAKGNSTADTDGDELANVAQQNSLDDRKDGLKPVYRCQATMLLNATSPLNWWNPRQYFEDLTSGNVPLGRMLNVSILRGLRNLMEIGVGYGLWRRLYDVFQSVSGDTQFPYVTGIVPRGEETPIGTLDLAPGENVRIKPLAEILTTIDKAKMNRGMRFDPEMVPYCGKSFTVRKRVKQIINEKTGKMIRMRTPSVILDGVVCESRYSNCRLFCPRAIPSYWREIWLERVSDRAAMRQILPDVE